MDTEQAPFDIQNVSTTFELAGHEVRQTLGVVRGLVVRSRSIFGTIGAAIQTLFGGNISLYAELCEKARADAFSLMVEQAMALGANAIIGVRYDANEVTSGVTEVLAYGTAVYVEPHPASMERPPSRGQPYANGNIRQTA